MNQAHLADDRLIELCLDGSVSADDEQHLVRCGACEARRITLAQLLDDVGAAAALEADAAFPAERLARQQTRILHRIEQGGRPGRLIAFPAGQPHEPPVLRPAPSTRWVAAAAAAGLIVGLFAGHLASELPAASSRASATPSAVAQPIATGGGVRNVSVISDDEFLGQIELAVGSGGPAMLRPLDALTPRSWDVR